MEIQDSPATPEELAQVTDYNNNKLIRQPIARIDQDVMKNIRKTKVGRKLKFTPTKLKNGVNGYFAECEKKDKVPSKTGLMLFLKMSPPMFYAYMDRVEFKEIMTFAEMIIEEWCSSDVYATPGAASGKIAYMKNKHDWREKQEIDQTTQNISIDEARIKIEAFLPQLLESIRKKAMDNKLEAPEVEEGKVIDISSARTVA
jgi:hypothetical protein